MNYEQCTLKSQEALQEATSIAQQADSGDVDTCHLLQALLTQEDGIVPPLVDKIGASRKNLLEQTISLCKKKPKVYGQNDQLYFSGAAGKVLAKSQSEADSLKDEYISTEHILIALTLVEDEVSDLLIRSGITKDTILLALKDVRGNDRVTSQDPEATFKSLERFCRDLTALARQGKIDPVIGRDEEIRRVMQVLSRRTKNNPVLIGEPGVGKTAIVEGLARRIVSGDVPESLKNKKLLVLDLGALDRKSVV